MSKSLGNGIDPMDMIDEYGADALRYYLNTDCAFGTDLRFDETKMSSTWNYINKIWNASRFVLMNIEGLEEYSFDNLTKIDKWILNKYENIVKSTISHMDKYEFNLVGAETYDFVWNDFCSNYIEFAKFESDSVTTKSVLCYVLTGILKILHPFMPFVTEEIYNMLPIKDAESIMISKYPEYNYEFTFEDNSLDLIIDLIKRVRKIKLENNLDKNYLIVTKSELVLENKELISKVLKNENILTSYDGEFTNIDISFEGDIVSIYYDGSLSDEEKERLVKEKERLISSIERREKLLSNENYVNKAPVDIVESERKSLAKDKDELEIIIKKLN